MITKRRLNELKQALRHGKTVKFLEVILNTGNFDEYTISDLTRGDVETTTGERIDILDGDWFKIIREN